MNKHQINGDQLKEAGFPEGKAIGIALLVLESNYSGLRRKEILALFRKLAHYPDSYLADEILGGVACELIAQQKEAEKTAIPLREQGLSYSIYGADQIEAGAIDQMNVAVRLPVSVAGALMPDAHQGYGLPIGGVLATDNAIIPYAVGVDIGCRMALSVFDIPESHFTEHSSQYKRDLIAWTKFGAGAGWQSKFRAEHAITDRPEFNEVQFIKALQQKAAEQLGTSGGGNHFAEFGIIEFPAADEALGVPAGRYLALLTHSGSRALGATIANHYTKLAKQICRLPKEAANLAWLDMNSAEGQEYWMAMNLAGDYASACHEIIHQRLTRAVGGQLLARVENHHNFAWKEQVNGKEVIVHRKGATPAAKGVMGIIPGSMTAPGFLVRGKGEPHSLNSAAHGAGRQMSRTKAESSFTRQQLQQELKDAGVMLIGAGLDEAPGAYKNIETVMAAQHDLVDIVARFSPKMVRMADDGSRED